MFYTSVFLVMVMLLLFSITFHCTCYKLKVSLEFCDVLSCSTSHFHKWNKNGKCCKKNEVNF